MANIAEKHLLWICVLSLILGVILWLGVAGYLTTPIQYALLVAKKLWVVLSGLVYVLWESCQFTITG
jgi:CBS domain containing-hemolysin-like protein